MCFDFGGTCVFARGGLGCCVLLDLLVLDSCLGVVVSCCLALGFGLVGLGFGVCVFR